MKSNTLGRFQKAAIPAVLGALLVTGVSELAPSAPSGLGGIQLAAADRATDGMSYNLSMSNQAQFANAYDNLIGAIRGRVHSVRLYGNVSLTRNVDDYFGITLASGSSTVTLVMNARNLYVVGWWNMSTNVYYRLGEGPTMPVAAGSSQNRNWLSYSQMENAAGANRVNVPIELSTIQRSIEDLGGRGSTPQSSQARALMILVQTLSEGARFDFISYRISQAIRGGRNWTAGQTDFVSGDGSSSSQGIGVTGADLENNWSTLSTAVVSATQNATQPNVQIGGGRFTTLAAIDAQLAIALRRS
ncbi:ribosome-inactivating family protein [Streptomyces sp. cg40]|uniref:ribosome-inactivating family protein n=1 Tax=Streptomyces sp. cg40 TaxID=3419764 RepID=UPI003D07931A